MAFKECRFVVITFLVCLINCRADDPAIIDSPAHSSSTTNSLISKIVALASEFKTPMPTVKAISDVTSKSVPTSNPDYNLSSSKTKAESSTSINPPVSPSTVHSDPNPLVSPTVKSDALTLPVIPSTVTPDPDTTTTSHTTPSTTSISTASTTKPTTPSSTTKTTATSTTHSSTSGSTTVTTSVPPTTSAPEPHHNRQFDGPSFMGGIVLASGLMAIGFVAFKFYKARTERNYHTL